METEIKPPIFKAKCIEHGDRFEVFFRTSEKNKEKLYNIGMEFASEWGGECLNVNAWKPKTEKCIRLSDSRHPEKETETTLRRWINFIKRSPQCEKFYTIIEKFDNVEPEPKDCWNCDLTHEENMKK